MLAGFAAIIKWFSFILINDLETISNKGKGDLVQKDSIDRTPSIQILQNIFHINVFHFEHYKCSWGACIFLIPSLLIWTKFRNYCNDFLLLIDYWLFIGNMKIGSDKSPFSLKPKVSRCFKMSSKIVVVDFDRDIFNIYKY